MIVVTPGRGLAITTYTFMNKSFFTLYLQNHAILWLVVFLCFSCKDGLFDSGNTVTHEIKINKGFSRIDIKNIFDITLVQDSMNVVLVTCGSNLQSSVSANVNDSILTVDQDTKFNWSRKYERIKLEIHLTSLSEINIRKPISLNTKGILTGNRLQLMDWNQVSEVNLSLAYHAVGLYMVSDNFGHYNLKGKCNSTYFEGWGSCEVQADSLVIADYCFVKHRGIGNVYVNVIGQLGVSLECSGNVYYTGNPTQINIEQETSTGRLIKMD
jgi:hypothetical protein